MSYATQLAGWVALQCAWETLAIALLLPVAMRLMRRASSEWRYRSAVLHLAAAIGALVLTMAVSHASIASGASTAPPTSAGIASLPSLREPGQSLLLVLAWIWLGGIAVTQAVLGVRLIRLMRLLRGAVPAPAEISALVEELSRRIGLPRPPRVCCADVRSPLVAGWRSGCVVAPAAFSETHPRAEAQALLAHELAHVVRRDYSSNILQLMAVSVLWWHPGVWFLYARIRHERECASDELALRIAGSAAGLANGLFRLAAFSARGDAVLVGADSSGLADRISRIAEPPMRQSSLFAPLLHVAAGALFTAMVVAASAGASRVEPLTRAWAASPFGPPTIFTIRAYDPAGTFVVRMMRGQVVGVELGREAIPPARVMQRGGTVRVVSQTGQELLKLEVDPRGGFRWEPRRVS